jgi:hypothetical protein
MTIIGRRFSSIRMAYRTLRREFPLVSAWEVMVTIRGGTHHRDGRVTVYI